jgi:uncharacterized protein YndB with AHSA1/START domain
MTKSIKHTYRYSHAPEAVWAYLTVPSLMAQWLMPTDFKPEVGYEFNFTTRPMPQFGFNGVIYCKVLEIVPNKKLVYSWKGGPGDGVTFTLDSVVTWILNPTANGTELHLEHSGFKEEQETAFTMMNKGWGDNIAKIEEFLTKKEVKRTVHFKQSPQEVWEYLTKPELIEQWIMKNDFKPVVGHKFCFTHAVQNKSPYDGTTRCEVLEVTPYTRLAYSWGGDMKDKSRSFNSTVVWTLTPKDNGTDLQVQHTGFTVLDDVFTHSSGWSTCLKRFQEHINAHKQ